MGLIIFRWAQYRPKSTASCNPVASTAEKIVAASFVCGGFEVWRARWIRKTRWTDRLGGNCVPSETSKQDSCSSNFTSRAVARNFRYSMLHHFSLVTLL